MELKIKVRPAGLKKLLGSCRYHIERRNGTPQQAADYCKKDGDFTEYGSLSSERLHSRPTLDEAKQVMDSGKSSIELSRSHFSLWVRHHRAFDKYANSLRTVRTWKTIVIWYWRATGTGKSRRASEEASLLFGSSVSWLADPTLQWFDPYAGDEAVIVDDFTGVPAIELLLRLLDRYPMQVPIKGGFVEWRPFQLWITSNFSPENLYGTHVQWSALHRRLDLVEQIE